MKRRKKNCIERVKRVKKIKNLLNINYLFNDTLVRKKYNIKIGKE